MLRVLFLMLVLLAGLVAGPYLSGKQGYVLIETAGYRYELSITMLVVIFVCLMAVVYGIEWIITRFLRASRNSYTWFSKRKREKAQRQTLQGLMKMDEGDYSKAEKLIGKSAKHSNEPVLNLIKAATAAQKQGDELSANRYLIEATEIAGEDSLIVEIARTRILLAQNKLPAARSAVDSLLVMTSRNKEVLKLAVKIYLKSHAYQALDDILDRIEKSGLYTSQDFSTLQRQVEDGLLDEKMNEEGVDGLLKWWGDQPRQRRNDLYVKIGMIRRLIDSDDHDSAYDLVIETLKKVEKGSELENDLCLQLTRLQASDNKKLLKLLEKRVKNDDGKCCCIYRALGYLYIRKGNFEKASELFKKVLANKECLQSNDTTMAIYAFEKNGELELAQQTRLESVKLAMFAKDQEVDLLLDSTPKLAEDSKILLEQK
ncbi:HemY protein [Bisgaardia hudsonensis]|uniref:HemY protein n=1 Tax=Bisgaardia hudsonensis TaxID=109472 RepID=A0A4R2MZZ2_9PAST|nr:heme biosynthesis protein HemY [Bisgaardia hudsonensis]QLB12194.1 heme biosynthesis protein HemY [Bisgaardia hudsonensis]TCP12233.1 HemY protein [Bisgaardia hudsonensis]